MNNSLTDWMTDWLIGWLIQDRKIPDRWTDTVHRRRERQTCKQTDRDLLTKWYKDDQTEWLIVILGKPSITLFKAPSLSSTYVGQSAVFYCVVIGDPDPVIHWKNSSNSIITSGGRFKVFSNGTLEIKNLLKTDDWSLYTCEATNSFGTTAASATLHVSGMLWNLVKNIVLCNY